MRTTFVKVSIAKKRQPSASVTVRQGLQGFARVLAYVVPASFVAFNQTSIAGWNRVANISMGGVSALKLCHPGSRVGLNCFGSGMGAFFVQQKSSGRLGIPIRNGRFTNLVLTRPRPRTAPDADVGRRVGSC